MGIFVEDGKAGAIRGMNRELASSLEKYHKAVFDAVWNGDTQAIFDDFGSDAVKLFLISQKVQDILAIAHGIEYAPLVPPKPYTINEDGTASVYTF